MSTLLTILLIAIGSALGGVGRYWLSSLMNGSAGSPWGAFSVDVLGSLVIGVLFGTRRSRISVNTAPSVSRSRPGRGWKMEVK